MRLDAVSQLSSLPNFAQALVALRMIHRAALARYPKQDAELELIESALAAALRCIRDGHGNFRHKPLFHRAMDLRDLDDELRPVRQAVRSGLWWAIDSVNAADMAGEFPVDATVTRSARTAFAALGEDPALDRTQILMLLAADIDQLLFACAEVDMLPSKRLASRYEGLGSHILGRLAPVHALALAPEAPATSESARQGRRP